MDHIEEKSSHHLQERSFAGTERISTMKSHIQLHEKHIVHDICNNFDQFVTAQEITKNFMENLGEWVSAIRLKSVR